MNDVVRGFNWIYLNIPHVLDGILTDTYNVIRNHDKSKFESDEYIAYDKFFYGENRSVEIANEFQKAWLLHIHRNHHHWQHWILISDESEEGISCIEMPKHYAIEMICDWWSFSWNKNNLTEIFTWYDSHKKDIQLHSNTRKFVEYVLKEIQDRVDES